MDKATAVRAQSPTTSSPASSTSRASNPSAKIGEWHVAPEDPMRKRSAAGVLRHAVGRLIDIVTAKNYRIGREIHTAMQTADTHLSDVIKALSSGKIEDVSRAQDSSAKLLSAFNPLSKYSQAGVSAGLNSGFYNQRLQARLGKLSPENLHSLITSIANLPNKASNPAIASLDFAVKATLLSSTVADMIKDGYDFALSGLDRNQLRNWRNSANQLLDQARQKAPDLVQGEKIPGTTFTLADLEKIKNDFSKQLAIKTVQEAYLSTRALATMPKADLSEVAWAVELCKEQSIEFKPTVATKGGNIVSPVTWAEKLQTVESEIKAQAASTASHLNDKTSAATKLEANRAALDIEQGKRKAAAKDNLVKVLHSSVTESDSKKAMDLFLQSAALWQTANATLNTWGEAPQQIHDWINEAVLSLRRTNAADLMALQRDLANGDLKVLQDSASDTKLAQMADISSYLKQLNTAVNAALPHTHPATRDTQGGQELSLNAIDALKKHLFVELGTDKVSWTDLRSRTPQGG